MSNEIQQPEIETPILRFILNPLWDKAGWRATTFQWHPTSESPPIMGIVFENADAGRRIFDDLAECCDNNDGSFDQLRISIIEGNPPGQRPGYSVHLCPDPEGLLARATAEGVVLDPQVIFLASRWNRMYPILGSPALLPRFKREFEKHQEFLLAPVIRRGDGLDYVDVACGIVKHRIVFRQLSEITENDIDAAALKLPELILPGQ